MAILLTIPCPSCGLALIAVEQDFKRNNPEDRNIHLHIGVDYSTQCINLTPHRWKVTSDILIEPVR